MQKISIENNGVVPYMQMCHPKHLTNLNYSLVATKLQLLWPCMWWTCQAKGTGREGEHIQCICANVVVADTLIWEYGHQGQQQTGMTIC